MRPREMTMQGRLSGPERNFIGSQDNNTSPSINMRTFSVCLHMIKRNYITDTYRYEHLQFVERNQTFSYSVIGMTLGDSKS